MVRALTTSLVRPNNRSHLRLLRSVGALASIVVLVACACLLFASGANASNMTVRGERGRQTARVVRAFPYSRFRVRGAHGYQVLVTGTPNGVRLIATRRHRAVEYLDPFGHATASGVDAKFGHLGHVTVKFRSNGKRPAHPPAGELKDCKYVGRNRERLGSFVGRIYFRGEHGYTNVQLRGAHGRSGFARLLRCPKSRPPIHTESAHPKVPPYSVSVSLPKAEFYAGSGAFGQLGLEAIDLLSLGLKELPAHGVAFAAKESEIRSSLFITRIAVAKGEETSFDVDQEGKSARLAPPFPFQGAAVVENCPTPEWDGALRVSFPGRVVHLLQQRFRHAAVIFPVHRCLGLD